MKTLNISKKMILNLASLFAVVALATGCQPNKKSSSNNNVVQPPLYGGCANCGSYAPGPVVVQGNAASASGLSQLIGFSVVADTNGYNAVTASGVRPIVNGSYAAGVNGTFRLTSMQYCRNGFPIPAGDYQIQMTKIGQMTNGSFSMQPIVNLVGPTTLVGGVGLLIVDANIDNVADAGSTGIQMSIWCGNNGGPGYWEPFYMNLQ